MKTKVTYILSHIYKSLEYEWIIRYLDDSRFELNFILLNDGPSELQQFVESHGLRCKHVQFRNKLDYPLAFRQVLKEVKVVKPDYVNCNLLDASLLGLSAAKLVGIKNRIYTRHHSTFHHVYFKKGILYDKITNGLATKIVAVSSLVKRVLVEKEGVDESKITVIQHGFDRSDFEALTEQRIKAVQEKVNPNSQYPVIGVISRYIKWKGVDFIVRAFKEIREKFPNARLVLVNSQGGDYADIIRHLLSELPKESYCELPFENDVIALYQTFDIFVHTPIDDHSEAFGRIFPEVMLAKIPMVCTISGIAHDIVEPGKNALVVDHQNHKAIAEAVIRLLDDPSLKKEIADNAFRTASEACSIQRQMVLLSELYSNS